MSARGRVDPVIAPLRPGDSVINHHLTDVLLIGPDLHPTVELITGLFARLPGLTMAVAWNEDGEVIARLRDGAWLLPWAATGNGTAHVATIATELHTWWATTMENQRPLPASARGSALATCAGTGGGAILRIGQTAVPRDLAQPAPK